jgi:pimeloyl-ACP methyl ester carboxylesterase
LSETKSGSGAVIKDSGHWIMEEQPEQAVAVILSFLAGK